MFEMLSTGTPRKLICVAGDASGVPLSGERVTGGSCGVATAVDACDDTRAASSTTVAAARATGVRAPTSARVAKASAAVIAGMRRPRDRAGGMSGRHLSHITAESTQRDGQL